MSRLRGIAAVECAIIVPVLALLVLGAIDVGQYANVYQKVSDASREAARVAAKYETNTTAQVQSVAADYLEQALSGMSPASLSAATQVNVTTATGAAIAGGDLTGMGTGTQVNVQVTLQYDAVRWLNGFPGLGGQIIAATTMMRRE